MVIGSMLILMMFSFQYQLTDTTNSAIYMAGMIEQVQTAYTKLHELIALAGIDVAAASTVTTAGTDSMVFVTKWDYVNDQIDSSEHIITIVLSDVATPLGKALVVRQDNVSLDSLGYIFWVDDLNFVYYNMEDQITTNPTRVYSAEIRLTFRHSAPTMGNTDLQTRLQMRCYLMNSYLEGA